jgi:uncharacterized protein (TIGR00661 family)
MKILYALQATGNGHICRAQKMVPTLRQFAEVDVLTSGTESDISLGFPVKYKYAGFSFVFGKQGGIQWFRSIFRNNFIRLYKAIRTVPVSKYDLVINDFEPVTAWACKRQQLPCVAMSHQFALLYDVPKPAFVPAIARWILHQYAPAKKGVGFHFQRYSPNIFFPIIRDTIRKQKLSKTNCYTVYLPSVSDAIICDVLTQIPQTNWEVFSKHCTAAYTTKNVSVQPPSNTLFQKSMAKATGVLCGAGFETPAEALFLKKKLLVVPMRDQYEQHYNAAGLADLGVPVLPKFSSKYIPELIDWVDQTEVVEITYTDDSIPAIEYIFSLIK